MRHINPQKPLDGNLSNIPQEILLAHLLRDLSRILVCTDINQHDPTVINSLLSWTPTSSVVGITPSQILRIIAELDCETVAYEPETKNLTFGGYHTGYVKIPLSLVDKFSVLGDNIVTWASRTLKTTTGYTVIHNTRDVKSSLLSLEKASLGFLGGNFIIKCTINSCHYKAHPHTWIATLDNGVQFPLSWILSSTIHRHEMNQIVPDVENYSLVVSFKNNKDNLLTYLFIPHNDPNGTVPSTEQLTYIQNYVESYR